MFATLLESRSRSERLTGGAVVSVTAHAAVIAMAVLATSQATVRVSNSPDAVHPIHFPPAPAGSSARTSSERKKAVDGRLPIPIDIKRVGVELPPIDMSSTPMTSVDFPLPTNGGATGKNRNNWASNSEAAFDADQVEKQVAFIPGSASPRYPDALRSSGVEGQVTALFVVDAAGRAEMDSVRFLRADNRLFEDAVRAALPRMRFVPAEIGGRKVRQLVQMPFVFTIGR